MPIWKPLERKWHGQEALAQVRTCGVYKGLSFGKALSTGREKPQAQLLTISEGDTDHENNPSR